MPYCYTARVILSNAYFKLATNILDQDSVNEN